MTYLAQFILVVGSAVDGLRFFGPFESLDAAGEYANLNHVIRTEPWCVTQLTAATNQQWTPPAKSA